MFSTLSLLAILPLSDTWGACLLWVETELNATLRCCCYSILYPLCVPKT